MTEVVSEMQISQDNISGIFRAINKSGNGQISWSEFVQASFDSNIIVRQENLEKVFRVLSKGSETISASNLREAFGSTPGVVVSDNQWNIIVHEVSQNDSGEIHLNDFCNYMRSVIKKRMQITEEVIEQDD